MCISAVLSSSHLQRMRASGFAALKGERGGSGRDRISSRMCQCGESSHTLACLTLPILNRSYFMITETEIARTSITLSMGVTKGMLIHFGQIPVPTRMWSVWSHTRGPCFTRLLYNPLVSVMRRGMLIS